MEAVVTDEDVVRVTLEYIPSQKRVVMRGVHSRKEFRKLSKLTPESIQNTVDVFLNKDMGITGVFGGLIPEPESEK
jgi:hypothetical protein